VLVLVALAATALMPPAPAPADAGDGAALAASARIEIGELIALDRAGRGALRLNRVPSLDRAATAHAADMVARGFFSHLSPEGSRLADRLRAAGYLDGRTAWQAGEVLAWGTGELASPAAAVRMWLESPPHRRALRRRAYRELGVGVASGTPGGGEGATYAVVLGARARR
jgi:uncharacterized protein YkwD